MNHSGPSTDPAVSSPRRAQGRIGRGLALHALVLGLWLTGFAAARLLEYAPHASLWFPPAAVTFAALLVFGARALPALWTACVLATLWTDSNDAQGLSAGQLLASNLGFAVAHTLAYGLVAWPLRWLVKRRARASRTLFAMVAFLLGGALAAALAAISGALALSLSGMIPRADVAVILVPWWIGDYAGLVALAPLLVLLFAGVAEWAGYATFPGIPRFAPRQTRSLSSFSFGPKLTLLLGYSALVLVAAAGLPQQEALIFALFVSMVIQLWIVHTEGETQALVAIATFSLLLAMGTAMLNLGSHALTLQFALICLAANSHFGLVVPRLYADNQRLRQLLTHDRLTGVLSRAFFEDRAREGMRASQPGQQSVALLMIDLDNLKGINDSLGHAAGDLALRALTDACAACLRPVDAMGRLSGDEFCVFLPGLDIESAETVVVAMREALSASAASLEFPLQASFGAAATHDPDESYESLMARADAAMYRDKRGRGITPTAAGPV